MLLYTERKRLGMLNPYTDQYYLPMDNDHTPKNEVPTELDQKLSTIERPINYEKLDKNSTT